MFNLDHIIPGEIKNDDFYSQLSNWASHKELKTFLEIGSSSGGGSTQALVDGIKTRASLDGVYLFCMELSRARFVRLSEAYAGEAFVKTYNVSSVAANEFPSIEEVDFFYHNVKTNINNTTLKTVLDWRDQDISYIKSHALDANGIKFIRRANNISQFDFVLIDGSEFTGERELLQTIGAKIIALDDINAFKCHAAFNILSSHFAYELISLNRDVRNGFAIFQKRY